MTVTAAPSSASRRPAAWTGSLPISTTVVPSSRAVSGVSATVHTYHLAGDVAGLVANEKGAGGGDVLGPSDPPHRRARHCILDSLSQVTGALGRPQHRRVYEARRNGVDGDALRAKLQGERLGEADDAGLGRYVVGHQRLAALGARRRDVDDAPPTGLDHVGNDGLAAVERPGEVDRQHAVPRLGVDRQEPVEALKAGVVDENRRAAETSAHVRDPGVDL